jgi:hypothetical protein
MASQSLRRPIVCLNTFLFCANTRQLTRWQWHLEIISYHALDIQIASGCAQTRASRTSPPIYRNAAACSFELAVTACLGCVFLEPLPDSELYSDNFLWASLSWHPLLDTWQSQAQRLLGAKEPQSRRGPWPKHEASSWWRLFRPGLAKILLVLIRY